jgi:hypothetical protein
MPSVEDMRTLAPARLLLGIAMLVVSCGLLVVGTRLFFDGATTFDQMALDGPVQANPVDYVVPWMLAVVLVAASYHLLRGRPRDQVF